MPKCSVCQGSNVSQVYDSQIAADEKLSFSYTFSPLHNKTFAVYRCKQCSHQFCYPVPPDIGKNYLDVVDSEYLKHEESRRATGAKSSAIIKSYIKSGKLLDIGCATGEFLCAGHSDGLECEGLEPSAWSGEIARKRGFRVHGELLETFAAKHRSEYDVVTLWGVIEHFSDPITEVARIQQILKPGGLLFVWTGDVDSITSRILGRRWWYWQGQHIQYFTFRSLKHLFSLNGLQTLSNKIYPFATSYQAINNSLKRYKTHRLMTTLLKPFFVFKPMRFLYLPGEMLVVARKD